MKTHQPWKESTHEKIHFINMAHNQFGRGPGSTPDPIRPVNFQCSAPGAKTVQLAGNFNHWHPLPMRPQENGRWSIQIPLSRGCHQYRFLVDGQPMLDPHATGTMHDEQGGLVSLIAIRGAGMNAGAPPG